MHFSRFNADRSAKHMKQHDDEFISLKIARILLLWQKR